MVKLIIAILLLLGLFYISTAEYKIKGRNRVKRTEKLINRYKFKK